MTATLSPWMRSPVHVVLSPKQSSAATCCVFVVDCSV
jgi:hypothetical protein